MRLFNRPVGFLAAIMLAALVAAGCGAAATSDDAGAAIAEAVVESSASNDAGSVEAEPIESAVEAEQVQAEEVVTEETIVQEPASGGDDFPDIVEATATEDGNGSWTFAVTVSSPYDSVERYADAWRVVDADGNELGIRVLAHHHANEQPFTRSQSGIVIPEGVTEVTIQGRDLANGWGGGELTFTLP